MKRLGLIMFCGLATLAPLFFLGCEVASSASRDTQLTLEPRNVRLSAYRSQSFAVSGGYDYEWSLKDETWGRLNKRTGNEVIYTSETTNSVVQQLTVTSFILGAGSSSTNSAGSRENDPVTATAFITHTP